MAMRDVCRVLAVAVLALLAAPACAAEARADTDSLTVTGSGEVRVVPDVALVSLGVETRSAHAGDAIRENNRLMSQVAQAIRRLEIPERNIQTSQLSVSREYEPAPEGQRPRPVYVVRNTVSIRLQDVRRVGAVIDAATEAGANTVQGVTFVSEKDQEARQQALRDAVRDAQSKAETIARALGVRLAGVESVVEAGGPIVYPQAAAADALAARAPTPVFAGENVIRATVTVRYRISR